ncbi:type VII secretion-associated serine protease mycosin [Micromonospora pisi]|uniref:Type VII secretion-associated serine protease mycosin n=1 Tax=Micromonospora pisi TaxID=589240 RepID=A0A495JIZ9_9ACTN|nr:S8 family serine peptidase [Micromonospora pisi]RKR88548.1 type VII secretion-associated serine protease mycosin [Micromonospora pisi]
MTPRTIRGVTAVLCATAIAVLPAGPAQADRIRDDQWHLRYLKVTEAHKLSQGAGVTVAVIDTGVDPHADLRNNLLPGTETFPGGTGDGRVDIDSHGTGMAGLIAAHGQSATNGALGIAPKAKILPIRYVRKPGEPDSDNVAKGIEWAIAQKTQVISVSIGGGTSPREARAVRAALAANIVIIAAAGNAPQDYGIGFPASYEGVVAVGASDRTGNRADVSVMGDKMGILAPGVDIYSTSMDNKYRKGTGTSDSTAIVAGAAALIRSRYPDLSAEEVVHRLTATAVDKGAPGHDEEYGDGVLDLMAALTADVPPLAASATPSATASASPSPTASADDALPGDAPEGMSTNTLLVTFAVFLLLAVVIALLVVRSHRRAAGRGGAPPIDPA